MILALSLEGCDSVFYIYFILMAFIRLQIFFWENTCMKKFILKEESGRILKKIINFFHKKGDFSKNLKGKKVKNIKFSYT